MTVDPVTLEVLRHAATAVCEEMNATLVRTGYSPNIKERRDCSCALFDADGQLVAQAESMPVHLGAMPFSVEAALEAVSPETLEPGQSIVLNDPFAGGAHLPDITLVTPVMHDGEPVAYAANRAHHADVGGARAGSVAADTTEIYQEGVRIPPVPLTDHVRELLLANVRTPAERAGDLRAQESANDVGRRRTIEVLERHGQPTFTDGLEAIQTYAERRMCAALAELPDGEATFEDALEDDGAGNRDLQIRARVTVEGESIEVDFAGTASQTTGPVNAVRAVTASATYYAIRAVTDPSIPPCAGCYRPIEIVTPGGSLVDPDPPAAVVAGNLEASQRITDVVLGALAELVPTRSVAAGQGTMNNLTVGGQDPRSDTPFAFYETQAGGFGAHADGDGMDAVHVHMSNTRNTPVEVLETAYPLRVRRYELRPDSGGPGTHRGGHGLRRDIEVRADGATVSVLAERHRSGPYGLEGGRPGATGGVVRYPDPAAAAADEDGEPLPSKTVVTVPAGTVISLRTPGGGGFGDPTDRNPEAVRADVRAGTVSPTAARDVYEMDIDP